MTGKLRLGKISIGIRTTASIEQRATPITITMTLIGRRSAARSSHILTALPAFYHAETAGTFEGHPAKRRPQPDSARRQAGPQRRRFLPALGGSARPQHRRESRAPIDNALSPESPLRARYQSGLATLVDEPRLITRSHLSLRCARRVQFLWRILSNAASPFERSLCLPQLPRQVLQGLIVTSRFGTFICRFNRSSRPDPEDVEYRNGHRQANPPVRTIRA